MLQIEGLSLRYGRKKIFDRFKCSIEDGVYFLLGPNGYGKTSLLRCISNTCNYKGSILYNGTNKYTVGFLPQHFGAFDELTTIEMLQYIATLKSISFPEKQINEFITKLNMDKYKNDKTKTLSGGSLQRLGIAQALLGNPSVILLDEPSVGLDPKERNVTYDLLKSINYKGLMIISTHIIDDCYRFQNSNILLLQRDGIIMLNVDKNDKTAIEANYLKTYENS